MSGWEAAALVMTVVAFALTVQRLRPDPGRPTLSDLFALLSGDWRHGRRVPYSLAGILLATALLVWALRLFHLTFYGPD